MFKVYAKDHKYMLKSAHKDDAGLDLIAAETVTLRHGNPVLVKCGVHLEIARGCVGLIFPRSGLASKHGVTLANDVGVIDSNYRGEIMCSLILNAIGCKPTYTINEGDRIAQLVTLPLMGRQDGSPLYQQVENLEDLTDTDRGEGGFGSSGK